MISPQKDNLILSSFVIDWYKSQGRASLPWRHNISHTVYGSQRSCYNKRKLRQLFHII